MSAGPIGPRGLLPDDDDDDDASRTERPGRGRTTTGFAERLRAGPPGPALEHPACGMRLLGASPERRGDCFSRCYRPRCSTRGVPSRVHPGYCTVPATSAGPAVLACARGRLWAGNAPPVPGQGTGRGPQAASSLLEDAPVDRPPTAGRLPWNQGIG